MAQGASGTSGGYSWVEYRNPGKGAFRGLEFTTAGTYFVGVSGDTDTANGKHSEARYKDIANQIVDAITWNEQEQNYEWPQKAQVSLPIGGKNKTVDWIQVPDQQIMINSIKFGLTNDETELWSDEAKQKAAAFLQSKKFLDWQAEAVEQGYFDMQNPY